MIIIINQNNQNSGLKISNIIDDINWYKGPIEVFFFYNYNNVYQRAEIVEIQFFLEMVDLPVNGRKHQIYESTSISIIQLSVDDATILFNGTVPCCIMCSRQTILLSGKRSKNIKFPINRFSSIFFL